ncbi:MAG TPA: hypothetical protein VGV89_01560 [Thermoplasmata archaeon]|nr:hypothetical protein [Thermoplasmata archaeon]
MTTKPEPLALSFYGGGGPPEPTGLERLDRFVARLERDRSNGWPVVVVIDGWKTGAGKSTLGIQICRRLDPKFALTNVVYSARELQDCYASLPSGSMVLYDESVLGLLTRKGSRDDELSGLIGALSIVRKNGIGTILTVPKIRMLDTIVYNGLAPYWIYIEDRGRGRVHRAHKGPRYRNSQSNIAFDRLWALSPLGWRSLDRDPLFRAYNERAIEHNRQYFREQAQISDAKRRRLLGESRGNSGTSSHETGPDRRLEGGVGGSPRPDYCCQGCGRRFDNAHNLGAHRCAAATS